MAGWYMNSGNLPKHKIAALSADADVVRVVVSTTHDHDSRLEVGIPVSIISASLRDANSRLQPSRTNFPIMHRATWVG